MLSVASSVTLNIVMAVIKQNKAVLMLFLPCLGVLSPCMCVCRGVGGVGGVSGWDVCACIDIHVHVYGKGKSPFETSSLFEAGAPLALPTPPRSG